MWAYCLSTPFANKGLFDSLFADCKASVSCADLFGIFGMSLHWSSFEGLKSDMLKDVRLTRM